MTHGVSFPGFKSQRHCTRATSGILGVNRVALLAEAFLDENGPSKHRPDAGHY